MLSKIKKLIKTYNKKVYTISKELRELAKNDDREAYMKLLKEQGVYIEVIVDLEDIIK